MIVEISDTRRPPQLTVNRYMSHGKPMYDEWHNHYTIQEDGTRVYGRPGKRFETWVEKEYFDSIEVSDGLCEVQEFMFRMYRADYDWGMLWSGAKAILKETVDFDGTDYYCIIFECTSMVHNHVPKDRFMELYNNGMSIPDIVKEMGL